MKLFLTSAGLINKEVADKFISQLSKPVEENRVLIIAYAQTEKEKYYVNESKKEIVNLGFKHVEVVNIGANVDIDSLGNFDVIYVCGGNTFSILNKLREAGLDEFIVNQIENGSIYVGVSAGSILAGPDIEIAGWGDDGDENEIGLQDLSGLDVTNVSIYPHFVEDERDEIERYKKQSEHEVIEISDNQAVYINGSDYEILGKSV